GGAAMAGSVIRRTLAAQRDTAVHAMSSLEQRSQRQMLNPVTLARFVDPLPVPVLAQNDGTRPSPVNHKIQLPYYRVELTELQTRLHRDIAPTRQWGYAGSVPGPTFETRSGQGLLVEWVNRLPRNHFLPVDRTVHGAEVDKPEVRTVAH